MHLCCRRISQLGSGQLAYTDLHRLASTHERPLIRQKGINMDKLQWTLFCHLGFLKKQKMRCPYPFIFHWSWFYIWYWSMSIGFSALFWCPYPLVGAEDQHLDQILGGPAAREHWAWMTWMIWNQNIWESKVAGKSPRTEAFHGKIIYTYSIIFIYIHLSMEKNLPFPQISTCGCGEPIASLRSFIVSPGTVTQPLLSPRQVPGTDSEPPGRFRSTRGLGEVPGTQLGPTWGWMFWSVSAHIYGNLRWFKLISAT